jgi:hypothetical protein
LEHDRNSTGGARDDVRVIQTDLDILKAGEIAARLRERVRELPQAEAYSADEPVALCTRLRETIKLQKPSIGVPYKSQKPDGMQKLAK